MVKLGLIGTGESQSHYDAYIDQATDIVPVGHWTDGTEESLIDFLLKTDAVVVLDTPDPVDTILTAFRSGRHVMLDSAHLLTPEIMDQLIGSRKEAGVCFQAGMAELFHPGLLRLNEQEIAPRFIEAYRVIDHRRSISQDLVQRELLRDIALISHLVPSDVKRIAANGVNTSHGGLELVNARLEFANGCVAVLTVNHLRQGDESKLTLYEENRLIEVDLPAGTPAPLPKQHEKNDEQLTISLLHDMNAAHINRLRHFTQCILEKSSPMLKLRDTYRQIEIAHKILKKINSLREE